MKNKTVILGASTNPERAAFVAAQRLVSRGHVIVPIGIKKGAVAGATIINDTPPLDDVETVTLYLNPQRQEAYYEYILSLHPKRIIFNPGTENFTLARLARERGIETVNACTLVMLATGEY